MAGARTGGEILADQIAAFGGETLFTSAGARAFLGLLDGALAAPRARPGRHLPPRGRRGEHWPRPGASSRHAGALRGHAGARGDQCSNGVHTAVQDSTPMILLIGQVARAQRDREAFQEVDYRAMFSHRSPSGSQRSTTRARTRSISPAPGPSRRRAAPARWCSPCPRTMLAETRRWPTPHPRPFACPAPDIDTMARLGEALATSERPLLRARRAPAGSGRGRRPRRRNGPSSRPARGHRSAVRTSSTTPTPTTPACSASVRCPSLPRAVREKVDLLIVVGARMGEITTGGYTLLDIPSPRMRLAHVHPAPDEIAGSTAPTSPSHPRRKTSSTLSRSARDRPDRSGWTARLRSAARPWCVPTDGARKGEPSAVSSVHLGEVPPRKTPSSRTARGNLRRLGAPLPPLPRLANATRPHLGVDGLRRAPPPSPRSSAIPAARSSPSPATAAS